MNTIAEDESITGPLGSVFHRIRVPPSLVPELAHMDWNKLGKRVMIDPVDGRISWISPDFTHESGTRAADKIVLPAGIALGEETTEGGGNRWKRPEDPINTGREADASFYIGSKAKACMAADLAGGNPAMKEFGQQNPPDLVVEVEVTHFDARKPAKYAQLGVCEMWQINERVDASPIQAGIKIITLQAEGGPCEAEESLVLRGLKASTLPQAYHLARYHMMSELQTLLKRDLIVPVSAPEPRKTPLPPKPRT